MKIKYVRTCLTPKKIKGTPTQLQKYKEITALIALLNFSVLGDFSQLPKLSGYSWEFEI